MPSDVVKVVQHTRELERILNLPRRTWDPNDHTLANALTDAIKRPGGRMRFRPIQAQALYEAAIYRGGFFPIAAGEGKTLLGFLLAYVMQINHPLYDHAGKPRSYRTVLITRANLLDKTRRDQRELSVDWPIPNFVALMSYEALGRVNHKDDLKNYAPDLIILDEAHRARNLSKAACARVIAKYMGLNPQTRFVAMSGTMTKRSLRDYKHLITWALKPENTPLPDHHAELETWAEALDEFTISSGKSPTMPGALTLLCTPEERVSKSVSVKAAYRRRLVDTPGVVSSSDSALGCSLLIQALECPALDGGPVDDAFQRLRGEWVTPDDWPISDPMTLWRHANEIGLGFFYQWNPRPPDAWMFPRKEWAYQCRKILGSNRRDLYSELAVTNAVDLGYYPDATPALAAWRAVRDTFVPNTVPVWIDDGPLNLCAKWAAEKPGVVWTAHRAFAERLAYKTGLVYYGRGGLDAKSGRPIEDHPAGESLIASIKSSGEGRNLQKWNRGLLVSCPTDGTQMEQVLARHHRPGQLADEVVFDVLVTCLEHVLAMAQAQRDATHIEATMGRQRLNYADINFPMPEEINYSGARWQK